MGRADQILELLRSVNLPLDDDDIADRLGINRHYVNAVCRDLAGRGLIARRRGSSGKLVNLVAGETAGTPTTGAARENRPSSGRRVRRADRARSNVEELIATFDRCVEAFESNEAFAGPSLYFHERAIAVRRSYDSAEEAVRDPHLLELIYAVLPSWGMHRMGRQAAKVGDFYSFSASIQNQVPRLQALWTTDLREVTAEEAQEVAAELWAVVSELKVSTSRSKLVSGSKTLHHLLPDLVPPIDRQYTFHFFTGQTQVNRGEKVALLEWFPLLSEIARRCDDNITDVLRRGGFMASSPAKVVDNAIMGFRQMAAR